MKTNQNFDEPPCITIALYRDGESSPPVIQPISLRLSLWAPGLYLNVIAEESSDTNIYYNGWYTDTNGIETQVARLYSGYPANGKYRCWLSYESEDGYEDTDSLKYIVVGHYGSADDVNKAIQNNNQKDIKDQILWKYSISNSANKTGYLADFSKGIEFTAVDTNDYLSRVIIKTETSSYSKNDSEDIPYRQDPYFRIEGAKSGTENETAGSSADGGELMNDDLYILPSEHDAYYANGFQTVLVNDEGNGLTKIKPVFYAEDIETIYYGTGDGASEKVEATSYNDSNWYVLNKAIDFGKQTENGAVEPVAFSVKSKDGATVKNYWVTFVKKATGPKLFVNGINGPQGNKRELFLTSEYENRHDIFIANVGNQQLTGLTVTLKDAENVKLDDYWTVGGDGNNSLAAFNSTETPEEYGDRGELNNVAKIRLVPTSDNGGAISGTLVISYDKGDTNDGKETIEIELSGVAGDPTITTKNMKDAVKYVPYSTILQTSIMNSDLITPEFSIASGELPDGLTLDSKTGEIFGAAQETGTFSFTVKMDCSLNPSAQSSRRNANHFESVTKEFELVVKENTDENVDAETDDGYDITQRVADMTESSYQDQEFVVSGDGVTDSTFKEFDSFWLDGKKLEEDDYEKEEGSTKITIKRQTFRNAGAGKHTIAAAFRNSAKELKRSAQNYNVKSGGGSASTKPSNPGNSTPNPENPSTNQGTTDPGTTTPPEPDGYEDVPDSSWYYSDVEWANENGLMSGIGNGQFDPSGEISDAMVAAVLARLAKADLNPYAGQNGSGIPSGEWYTGAALWAKANGLFPSGFSADGSCSRGKLAVVLKKYLDSQKLVYTLPAETVTIADRDQMTQEEAEAFELLTKLGIFKGTGDDMMNPGGITTRAELATLLHRVSDFVEGKDNNNVLTDLESSSWYFSDVSWAASSGLMIGTGNKKFQPSEEVSGAMAATVLARLAKADLTQYADDSAAVWYGQAAAWAKANGLTDSSFTPESSFSRGRLAVMLKHYLDFLDLDYDLPDTAVAIADRDQMTAEEAEAFETLSKLGIFNGREGNLMDAQGSTTRAELAALLHRVSDFTAQHS